MKELIKSLLLPPETVFQVMFLGVKLFVLVVMLERVVNYMELLSVVYFKSTNYPVGETMYTSKKAVGTVVHIQHDVDSNITMYYLVDKWGRSRTIRDVGVNLGKR